MPKLSAKQTSSANLEEKFDAGEDVLDYFDIRRAKVVLPSRSAVTAPRQQASFGRRASIDELKRAIKITERIQKLERELHSILGG